MEHTTGGCALLLLLLLRGQANRPAGPAVLALHGSSSRDIVTCVPPFPPHPHALRTDRQADRRAARTYVSFRQVGPLDSTHRRVYVCVCPHAHLSSPQSVPSPREPAGAAIDGGGLLFSVVLGGGGDWTGLDWTGSRGESAHCRLARQGGAWQSPRCCCCCCCWCCIVAAYLVGSLQGLDPETTSAAVRAAAAPASGLPPELAQGGRGSERA